MLVLGKKQIRGGFLIGSGFSSEARNLPFPAAFLGVEGCIGPTKLAKGTFVDVAKSKLGRVGDSVCSSLGAGSCKEGWNSWVNVWLVGVQKFQTRPPTCLL